MKQSDLFPPMKCDECGATLHTYAAVGYDGPANRDCLTSCHPFMPWLVLCEPCSTNILVPSDEV